VQTGVGKPLMPRKTSYLIKCAMNSSRIELLWLVWDQSWSKYYLSSRMRSITGYHLKTFTIRISRCFSSAREFQMGNFQKYWSQNVGQDFIVLDFFVGGRSCGRLMSPAHETQSMREIRLLRGRPPWKGIYDIYKKNKNKYRWSTLQRGNHPWP
jgi:hypothetical protein